MAREHRRAPAWLALAGSLVLAWCARAEPATLLPAGYEVPFARGLFAPADTRLEGADALPPGALAGSRACGACHPTIYGQWAASLHRSAAIDPFFRFAVERMGDMYGVPSTRLCVACHEPGALLAGGVDRHAAPDLPTRLEGLSCLSCHLITGTHPSTQVPVVANGSFTIALPAPDLLVPPKDDPEALAAHGRALRRPFLSQNDTCVDCHMPLMAGEDSAAKGGQIHDHRALGANVLVPTLLGDRAHAEATAAFRRAGAPGVEIGAWSWGDEGRLELPVTLVNDKNGHDFPTGAADVSEA